MSTFLSTIIGMCGCNKGIRGRHVAGHVATHIASPRTLPNRVSRAHYAPVQESVQVQVQESVQESVQGPVVEPVAVQRFPPRIVRGRIVLPVAPEPIHVVESAPVETVQQFPPRIVRGHIILPVAPEPIQVAEPAVPVETVNQFPPRFVRGHIVNAQVSSGPASHFPPRQVPQRFRGIPQRLLGPPAPSQPTYNAETTVWGPMLWKVLHTLAEFNTDAALWNELITQLTKDIPCVICRTHFTAYIQSQPITSFDTVTLINWFFTLHNTVNQRTNKPVVTTIPSFESFRASLPTLIQELSVSFPPETLQLLQQLGQNPP